ncbi:MAG: hypothetical protein DCC56_01040 [Anaerolineae bacterium]|nr:MAG: hypothetical protein DCC56_01040 [Anaerolineae bacterium]
MKLTRAFLLGGLTCKGRLGLQEGSENGVVKISKTIRHCEEGVARRSNPHFDEEDCFVALKRHSQ